MVKDSVSLKKQLERERNLKHQQIFKLQQEINQISEKIARTESEIKIQELGVTDHAIERFKQRVMDIPAKKIRQLLSADYLLEAYRLRGDGRFFMEGLSHVVVQINDFAVVTVINTIEPDERFKVLTAYMDYFIEEIALKYQGHDTKIMKLRTFKGLYYKNKAA